MVKFRTMGSASSVYGDLSEELSIPAPEEMEPSRDKEENSRTCQKSNASPAPIKDRIKPQTGQQRKNRSPKDSRRSKQIWNSRWIARAARRFTN